MTWWARLVADVLFAVCIIALAVACIYNSRHLRSVGERVTRLRERFDAAGSGFVPPRVDLSPYVLYATADPQPSPTGSETTLWLTCGRCDTGEIRAWDDEPIPLAAVVGFAEWHAGRCIGRPEVRS